MEEKRFDREKIERGVRMVLEGIGEDPEREGIRETPFRVAGMLEEILEGIHVDPSENLQGMIEPEHEEIVIVKEIPLYSICEHHLLPFSGYAHVAYIPKGGRIVGLSKIARVVDIFAKRLQLQERMTKQIAGTLYEAIRPYGVMVVIEAEHMCLTMRGVKKLGSLAVTSSVRGLFRNDIKTRQEALSLINPRYRRG